MARRTSPLFPKKFRARGLFLLETSRGISAIMTRANVIRYINSIAYNEEVPQMNIINMDRLFVMTTGRSNGMGYGVLDDNYGLRAREVKALLKG